MILLDTTVLIYAIGDLSADGSRSRTIPSSFIALWIPETGGWSAMNARPGPLRLG